MHVILLGPGYPAEIPFFARGLANVGATVLGVGDQPESELPQLTRESLRGYLRVHSLSDEQAVINAVREWIGALRVDRVESVWEPTVLLAARLREVLGVEGMRLSEVIPFRDKDAMKTAVAAAGLRVPRHLRAGGVRQCREAARQLGFPVVLKPIAGAGSADTFRVNDDDELESVLQKTGHISEMNVEEFIHGEEFTFDTISINGEIAFFNMAWYRPPPIIGRSVEWISPQTVTLRDVDSPELASGRQLGRDVLRALKFQTGFTHMEWYRKPDGEAVFGEIAARPPGARSVDIMNYACDVDLFTGWAEAVVHNRFTQKVKRLYNSAIIFKRAQGAGRIQRIEGVEKVMASFGEHIACVDLLPVGAQRRDWKHTLISDGFIVVRHPDLQATMDMADRIGTDLQLFAG